MPTAAAETLRATAVNEHILDARLFTRDGTLLATYMRPGASWGAALPEDATPPGVDAVALFEGNHLRVVRPISLNGEIIGSIAVESDTTEVWARLARFAAIVAGTLFGAFWIAFGLSRTTARLIFDPIARLIEVTRLVRDGGRYDVRADAGRRRRNRRADRCSSTRCWATSRSAISSCCCSRTTSNARWTRGPPSSRRATRNW